MEQQGHKSRKPIHSTSARPLGVGLGRIFGIELRADFSLLLIFALIVFNLGVAVFPSWHPNWSAAAIWGTALLAAVLFFASVAVHELSHALVGRAFGVPFRRITLFMFGGMAQMEAEPSSPKAEFMMAIVGPLVSIGIGIGATALATASVSDASALTTGEALSLLSELGPMNTLLLWLGPVNVLLGLFNLVPGFPLDGGRVLRSIFWWATGDLQKSTRWASRLGQVFAWFLIATGAFMLFGYAFPVLGAGAVQGLWLILIGWFLNNAARMSYQHLLMRDSLEGVAIRDIMRSRVETVAPDSSLAAVVQDQIMASDQQAFPVLEGEVLIGLLRLSDIRKVDRTRWRETRVREAMTPIDELHTMGPGDDAMDALRELGNQDPIPVIEGRSLVGVARRDDLIRWMALQSRAA